MTGLLFIPGILGIPVCSFFFSITFQMSKRPLEPSSSSSALPVKQPRVLTEAGKQQALRLLSTIAALSKPIDEAKDPLQTDLLYLTREPLRQLLTILDPPIIRSPPPAPPQVSPRSEAELILAKELASDLTKHFLDVKMEVRLPGTDKALTKMGEIKVHAFVVETKLFPATILLQANANGSIVDERDLLRALYTEHGRPISPLGPGVCEPAVNWDLFTLHGPKRCVLLGNFIPYPARLNTNGKQIIEAKRALKTLKDL
jgi:hypothetical protein